MKHEFCDHCPRCRPVLIDEKTGRALRDDSPLMQVVNQIWDIESTYAERKAFIEVQSRRSATPENLENAHKFMTRVESELARQIVHDMLIEYHKYNEENP